MQEPSSEDCPSIPVSLKWGKRVISGLTLRPGSSSALFKEDVQARTGVPAQRQKLFCRGVWQTALQAAVLPEGLRLAPGQSELVVTLLGSAEAPPEQPAVAPVFVEDLSPAAKAAAEAAQQAEAFADAEGLIVALQKPPGQRDDKKAETYKYSGCVVGLPQRQIEASLRRQRASDGRPSALLGECAMTLGLELGRAYVNVLAVLHDGTVVSGLDDGKVQLWRHGARIREAYHEVPRALELAGFAGTGQGVVCVASLPTSARHEFAFATGGNGSVKLWTADGASAETLLLPSGVTPTNLATLELPAFGEHCLAASFRRIREPNPNAFRLVPQNEAERQRRAQLEAAEAAFQARMSQLCRSVQLWLPGCDPSGGASDPELKLFLLEPEVGDAPVTALVGHLGSLVAGDTAGRLRRWSANGQEAPARAGRWQLALAGNAVVSTASIVCMEPLTGDSQHLLAVSTEAVPGTSGQALILGSATLTVPVAQAVFLVDIGRSVVLAVLDAHTDVVRCMCALPQGLATGGGKHDATLRTWQSMHWRDAASGDARPVHLLEAPKLKEPGYVFAITALPDTKPGSSLFALAAARYNVVKIVL